MRAFVFLLVLANLIFLAWTQGYLGVSDNPDAARLTQQLAAERLLILSRDQPPGERREPVPGRTEPLVPAAKPVETEVKAEVIQEKCLAWVGLSAAAAEAIDTVLAEERFSPLQRVRHSLSEASSWWVFIPSLTSRAEAEKKAGELRRLGVSEYFIMPDNGPYRLAISLGVFSSEQAAETRLNALRAKGVRSARMGPRQQAGRAGAVAIEAAGSERLLEVAREAVQAVAPEVRTAGCGRG